MKHILICLIAGVLLTTIASCTSKTSLLYNPNPLSNDIELVYIDPGDFPANNIDKIVNYYGPPTLNNLTSMDSLHAGNKVKVDKGFYIQKTEVTYGLWQEVMGKQLPEVFTNCDEQCPVVRLTYKQILQFIARYNEIKNTDKYRLPTEEEWELACRSGSKDNYSFGNDIEDLGDYAWYTHNSNGSIQKVGLKKPNLNGLYDMHGNVWEQTSTCVYSYYSGQTDPLSCSTYVVRGGGAASKAEDLTSWNRSTMDRSSPSLYIGFRMVREK